MRKSNALGTMGPSTEYDEAKHRESRIRVEHRVGHNWAKHKVSQGRERDRVQWD